MGIINKEGALILATGIDNSGLNSGLSDAEKRINSFGQTAQETGKSLNSALDIRQMVEMQKKVIADLEKQYAQAKSSFDNLGNQSPANHRFSDKEIAEMTKQYNTAKKLIQEAKTELDGEKNKLKELEAELNKVNKTREKSTNTATSYMTQMRKIRQEMQELAMAGKSDTDQYRKLEEQLARVGTAFNRVRGEQRLLTTAGNAQLAGMIQGIRGLAGAFSAGQGVASLFVKNNEQLAAIQTKLQAAMAITMGLQQVSNTLHTTSAFRISTVNKATQLWTATNYALGKSFIKMGMSANTAKFAVVGLTGTLTLGLSVAIIGIIHLYDKYKSKQEEIDKKNKEIADKAIAFNEKIADSVSKPITSYKKLQREWNSLSGSLQEKSKFIKDNKKEFESLGIEVKNVSDAENVLVNNTEAVITALKLRAQAVAYQELATESYKQAAKAQLEADKFIIDNADKKDVKLSLPGQKDPIEFSIDLNTDPAKKKSQDLSNSIIENTKKLSIKQLI